MENEQDDREESVTGGLHTISYIADAQGEQELIPGSVWQPVNIVNRQAWEEIEQHIAASKEKIAQDRVSCLHYYMIANQMDIGLLARYTGQARCLVRLHLIPFFFRRLGQKTLDRYAKVFLVSSKDLRQGILKDPVYNQQ
ncbi:MAG: hypothetical protein WGN25_16115 [Candidatus Electrothrix sp. GW3-4]|uniref:hypothetical protein n=1 Tax=Candidatus Electrothrix sp. GW3-4 TaxID=3126740 RepID=UPI0030CF2275